MARTKRRNFQDKYHRNFAEFKDFSDSENHHYINCSRYSSVWEMESDLELKKQWNRYHRDTQWYANIKKNVKWHSHMWMRTNTRNECVKIKKNYDPNYDPMVALDVKHEHPDDDGFQYDRDLGVDYEGLDFDPTQTLKCKGLWWMYD